MSLNRRIRFLAAASIALGAASFTSAQQRTEQPQSGTSGVTGNTGATSNTNNEDKPRRDTADPAARTGEPAARTGDDAAKTDKPRSVDSPMRAATPAQLIGRVVDSAVTGDPKMLAHYLYEPDRARFTKEGGQQQAQQQQPGQPVAAQAQDDRLPTAIRDLQRAWREKYTQDLTVVDADGTFGARFIRTNGGAPEARPAGGRIEGGRDAARPDAARPDAARPDAAPAKPADNGTRADPSRDTGASGTSAGTGGSAGRTPGTVGGAENRAAGGDAAANAQNATIPASHGLPEVQVSMIKEGEDWKLNVPDTLTPQRLRDNLARHFSMINQSKDNWPSDANQAQQLLAHHVMLAVMDQAETNRAADPGAGARPAEGAAPRTAEPAR